VLNESDLLERLKEQHQGFDDEARATQHRNSDLQRGIDEIGRKVKDKERHLARIEEELKKLDKANIQVSQGYEEVVQSFLRS
jgi:predicted nuclease with TOPRIM domain